MTGMKKIFQIAAGVLFIASLFFFVSERLFPDAWGGAAAWLRFPVPGFVFLAPVCFFAGGKKSGKYLFAAGAALVAASALFDALLSSGENWFSSRGALCAILLFLASVCLILAFFVKNTVLAVAGSVVFAAYLLVFYGLLATEVMGIVRAFNSGSASLEELGGVGIFFTVWSKWLAPIPLALLWLAEVLPLLKKKKAENPASQTT